jgi:hypothetical protein
LLANLQTAVFYPPNLLFRALPVEQALGYSVVLHIIGAGLAAYYWGSVLGLNRLGRMVTALSYALGGYAVGRTQFITMVAAYAWLPLLLALTERLVRRRRLADCAWLGGALALQFLAGHAQTWFYSLVLVGAYGACRTIQYTRVKKSSLPLLPLGVQGRPAGFTLTPSPSPSGRGEPGQVDFRRLRRRKSTEEDLLPLLPLGEGGRGMREQRSVRP